MPTVRSFATGEVTSDLLAAIRRMLDDAFEGDFSDDDWEHALGGTHFAVVEHDLVVAHAAVVPRALDVEGRPFRVGYVEAVGTHPARQGQGLGTIVMDAAADLIRRQFALGALGTESHGFYARLGWERWAGPTYVRRDGELVRTEEDDDGLMVLRFGTSASIELTGSLSCEDRPGDVW
jgi:aminoglycoside 2'-N-acetyltransferase I